MKEILTDLKRLKKSGTAIAMARVVDSIGSSPRELGATMAVNEDGEVVGSVSGGCVEGAVVTESLEVLETKKPRLTTFGYSDDEAFAVGLTCGGTLHIFIEPHEAIYDKLAENISKEIPTALATVVDGPNAGAKLLIKSDANDRSKSGKNQADKSKTENSIQNNIIEGDLGSPRLNRVVTNDALGQLDHGKSGIFHYGEEGERRETTLSVFIESFTERPRMIIFGAVDFTAALVRLAQLSGYKTIVCDARAIFATKARFPTADEIIVGWPDNLFDKYSEELTARDVICILTHDPKFDIPAIMRALETNVSYIGVMGSRTTHAKRVERLREEGVSTKDIRRLKAPIGLDIGARTPEETALSILAEIIATQQERGGVSLSQTEGPIHTR